MNGGKCYSTIELLGVGVFPECSLFIYAKMILINNSLSLSDIYWPPVVPKILVYSFLVK